MNKKRLIILSLISITLVSMLFLGNTYSLFTSKDIDENANVYKTATLDITYKTDEEVLKLSDSTPTKEEETVYLKPYRITVTNTGNVAYQFNIKLNNTTATAAIDTNYIMTQVGKIKPKPLSECQDNILKDGITLNPNTSVDIDVRVYLAKNIPNRENGKNFTATLSVDGIAIKNEEEIDNSNLIAEYKRIATTYIKNIYNDGSELAETSIKNEENKITLNPKRNILYDNNNEYRFYGKNPNNYLLYNNELYRIIGVFLTKDENNQPHPRVKIIKEDNFEINNQSLPLTNITWQETLVAKKLNTTYYNQLTEKAKTMANQTSYKIGTIPNQTDLYANDYYNFEHNTDNAWIGVIGLMNISDFMYATDLSKCKAVDSLFNNEECLTNNWLYLQNQNQMTMSQKEKTFLTTNDLTKLTTTNLIIRPVLYLNENVYITKGNGTKEAPYQIDNQ